jgi:hypothetical protein
MKQAYNDPHHYEGLEYNEWEGYGTDDCPAPTPYHVSFSGVPSSRPLLVSYASSFMPSSRPPAKRPNPQKSMVRKQLERQREQLRSALRNVEQALAVLP